MAAIPVNWQSRPVQTVDEAAAITTLCRVSIYDLAKKGELELVKLTARRSGVTTKSLISLLQARGVQVL